HYRLVGVQQKVADITVAMVDPGAMHVAGHLRHTLDQGSLEARRWRLLQPIGSEIFKADRRRQLLGDDEGMLSRRIGTPLAEGHGRHGGYASVGEPLNGGPFLTSPDHGGFQGADVLKYLAPANATMNLDEIATPLDFSAQGATTFQLAVDLALQLFHFGKGIFALPKRFERFAEKQFHQNSSRRHALTAAPPE